MRKSVGILAAALAFSVSAFADITDPGNMALGQNAVIGGTLTVSGSAFSVGGSTLSVNAGNVGIGTTHPQNILDVNGGMAIGSYAGTDSAPSNGLIVSGKVGIGTTSPVYQFQSNISGSSSKFIALPNDANVFNAALLFNDQTTDESLSYFLGTDAYGLGSFSILQSTSQYFTETNPAAFNNILTIDANGSVGIGTASPNATLNVRSNSSASGYALNISSQNGSASMFNVQGNGYANFIGGATFTGQVYAAGRGSSLGFSLDTGSLYEDSNANLVIHPQASHYFLIPSGNNVGIGTTNPAGSLDVEGSGGVILNAGNVGIGTTSPDQSLAVAGTIHSTSGGFEFPDGTTQASMAGVQVLISSGSMSNASYTSISLPTSSATYRVEIDAVQSSTQAGTIRIGFNNDASSHYGTTAFEFWAGITNGYASGIAQGYTSQNGIWLTNSGVGNYAQPNSPLRITATFFVYDPGSHVMGVPVTMGYGDGSAYQQFSGTGFYKFSFLPSSLQIYQPSGNGSMSGLWRLYRSIP